MKVTTFIEECVCEVIRMSGPLWCGFSASLSHCLSPMSQHPLLHRYPPSSWLNLFPPYSLGSCSPLAPSTFSQLLHQLLCPANQVRVQSILIEVSLTIRSNTEILPMHGVHTLCEYKLCVGITFDVSGKYMRVELLIVYECIFTFISNSEVVSPIIVPFYSHTNNN